MAKAFQIVANASQEVPAAAETGASATGYAIFDEVATTLTYFIRVSGLDFGMTFGGLMANTPDTVDDVVAAHFHAADRGANGAVSFNLFSQDADDFSTNEIPGGSQTLSGIWETTDPASSDLSTFASAFEDAAIGEDVGLYLNIHTAGVPSGAIRGQLVAISGPGDDALAGTPGADILPGLTGNDTYAVNDDLDVIIEDPGAGIDRVVYSALATAYSLPTNVEELFSAALFSTTDLSGNELDNLLDGNGELAARLHGLAGDDTLRNAGFMFGGEGSDTLIAAISTAEMHGQSGNDSLLGTSTSSELLDGGEGDDTLDGAGNGDTLVGGPGDDIFVINNLSDVITEEAAAGIDEIRYRNLADTSFFLPEHVENFSIDSTLFTLFALSGNSLDNVLDLGGIVNSTAMAEGGNDTILGAEASHGGQGDDSLVGGGNSTWHYGEAGSDTILGGGNGEFIYGGPGNDSLSGQGGDDTISGSSFDESVPEDGADDVILGGDGNDNLRGGLFGGHPLFDPLAHDGNDTLEGEAGNDTLTGGTGSDLLRGGAGMDSVFGGRGNDSAEGGIGNDRLDGNDGDDTLAGGEGIDTLLAGDGNDSLLGDAGNDQLVGGLGNDTLSAGDGDDFLNGENGNDSLIGGDGTDTARYVMPSSAATISTGGTAGTTVVTSVAGTDTLVGIERLAFNDETIEIDGASTGPSVRIEGDPTQGQTLTAVPTNVSGIDADSFRFHWLRDGSTLSPLDIDDGPTWFLEQDDVGATMSVRLEYRESDGSFGRVTSSETIPVANTNDPTTGFVTISGVVETGETLTADASRLSDLDGLGSLAFQWLRNGENIEGANDPSYTVASEDDGAVLSVRVSYTDGFGTEEAIIGQMDASGSEAVIQVTTSGDVVSAEDGETSLREAVIVANAFDGHTTILLGAGDHFLTMEGDLRADDINYETYPVGNAQALNTEIREALGPTEGNAALGDLDLLGNMTIVGAADGSSRVLNGMDPRAYHVHSGAEVTLQNFETSRIESSFGSESATQYAQDGGILLNTGGSVSLENVALRNALLDSAIRTYISNPKKGAMVNLQPSKGGAIFNDSGSIEISDSLIEGNRATFGGAIYADAGRVEIRSTSIQMNQGHHEYTQSFGDTDDSWFKLESTQSSKVDGKGATIFSRADAHVVVLLNHEGSPESTSITNNVIHGTPREGNSLIEAEGGSVFVEDGIALTGVGNAPETLNGVSRGPAPDASHAEHPSSLSILEATFAAAATENATLSVAEGFDYSFASLSDPAYALVANPVVSVTETEIVLQLAGARLIVTGVELEFPTTPLSETPGLDFLDILDGIVQTITLTNASGSETLASLSGLDIPADQIFERVFLDDLREPPTLESIVGVSITLADDALEDLSLTGTEGSDVLAGGAGMDTIAGLSGPDRLLGALGSDFLNGGLGSDTLNGGEGNDTILGGAGATDLRDVVFAGDGNDSVDAGAGNDQVFGQGGNDTIAGGAGVDDLQGQDGDDVITGSNFSDLVFGGAGDDFVNGGFGSDRINGGSGADKFFHVGVRGHGSDWLQDYTSTDGDVLLWGGGAATADDFQVNFAHTENAEGERAGEDDVTEGFVIYKPSGQIIWALVDGGGQDAINIQIGGDTFDLLG